jgi:hypothetical protein
MTLILMNEEEKKSKLRDEQKNRKGAKSRFIPTAPVAQCSASFRLSIGRSLATVAAVRHLLWWRLGFSSGMN